MTNAVDDGEQQPGQEADGGPSRLSAAPRTVQPDRPRRTVARRRRAVAVGLASLLVVYFALGLYYALSLPLWAKPDEAFHQAYVRYLFAHQQLPQVDTTAPPTATRPDYQLEAHQPPLYYTVVLAANVLASGHPGSGARPNPHFLSTPVGNRSPYVPGVVFAWGSRWTPVFEGRLVSLAFGLAALVFAYLTLAELFGPGVALTGVGLMALNPQYLFITTSYSNDAAGVATATLCLWLAARATRRGLTPRRGLGLGLAIGLATLAKLGGLGMMVVVGFVAVAQCRCAGRWRPLLAALLAPVGALAVAGWWFWRNLQVYREPFGTSALAAILGKRTDIDFDHVRLLLGFLWKGYWLDFSVGGIVFAEPEAYLGLGALALAAVAGCLVVARRRPADRPGLALLGVWLGTVLAGYLQLTLSTSTIMGGGRLVFPAAASVAGTLAVGLREVSPKPLRAPLAVAGVAALGLWAALAPGLYLLPGYPLVVVEAASSTTPATARFGDAILLVGWDLGRDDDGTFAVSLRWQVSRPPERDYSVFLQQLALDADGTSRVLAQIDTYPGYGGYPTGEWQAGQEIVDRLELAPAPVRIPPGDSSVLVLGLYDHATGERLPVLPLGDARARSDDSVVLGEVREEGGRRILARPGSPPISSSEFIPGVPVEARLGEAVEMVGYELERREVRQGEALKLRLYWRALRPVGHDYVVFTHLLDATGKVVAQQDNQPRGGTYPTSAWRAGELVADEYRLVVDSSQPAGECGVEVGLYDGSTGRRLLVTDRDGSPAGDRIALGTVVVRTK